MTATGPDLIALEERLAHLTRAVDDLSEVIARQDREMQWMRRRIEVLLDREAEREADAARAAPVDRPPHW